MSHQPFENWIFTNGLTLEQHKALYEHLQSCERCKNLQNRLHSMENQMRTAAIIAPPAGFNQRWRASFAERLERQQRQQVRRLFLLLAAAILISFAITAATLLVSSSVEALLFSSVKTVLSTLMSFNQFLLFLLTLVRMLPPAIPIALWILLTSGVALAAVVWLVSLWRISTQGVYIQ
ncbi:MAG: hypothetical protein HPY45_12795 [Anaerolineae bacterium]|nr:hypothetical protein [Anaerolineae bacterium]